MNNNIRLAAIFLLSLVIWFASGLISSSQSKESTVRATAPTGVQVTVFQKELYKPALSPVSYTHLTLPTICSV